MIKVKMEFIPYLSKLFGSNQIKLYIIGFVF